jgi:tight adherence protein B
MQLLIFAALFCAIAGLIVGAYLFLHRRDLAEAAIVRARIHGEDTPADAPSILKDTRASQVPFLDRLLRGRDMTATLHDQLNRAGSTQKPAVFLLTIAVFAVVGVAVEILLGGITGVLAIAAGLALPWIWLITKQRRRLALFDQKFPDTLDMMANAMRAGYSFQAAARFIGEEVPDPIGPEFARFYDEQRLGIDVRTALQAMQRRVNSLNLKMFVTGVLIQRETGGNLTELLDSLSTLMRERVALQGQIETLTAEPKLSARVLTALPVLLFFALRAANPSFMAPMIASNIGHIMLASAVVSVIIGYFILMKIADIDL